MQLLVLEDDLVLADILVAHLEEKGHRVTLCHDGECALEFIESQKFDMLILDINVPKITGPEVIETIRSYHITTPAMLITAYQDTAHVRRGFESGCDGYLKKPFDLEEFDVRLLNLSKHFAIQGEESVFISATIKLFPATNSLHVNEKIYTIAPKECEILSYFGAHAKRLIPTEELMQNLWTYDTLPSEATIRVYIKNLRNLIGKETIQTIRGSGYRFESA